MGSVEISFEEMEALYEEASVAWDLAGSPVVEPCFEIRFYTSYYLDPRYREAAGPFLHMLDPDCVVSGGRGACCCMFWDDVSKKWRYR